jgi:sigma-B regulation protein RsbU (phosphoserine phosphatase)
LVAVLGSVGQGLIERFFAPMDQLSADLMSLSRGDWFIDLQRPTLNNEVSRMQQALLVFQQQTIEVAQQSFEQKLALLRERALLETELKRIAQLLPTHEQDALQALLETKHTGSSHTDSPLAQGFHMVSAKVVDQQTRVNELLAQRTADLALIQQSLRERTQLDRLREELVLATKLQMANLPQVEAAEALRPTLDLFATMRSAREVGGDFYDFFQLNPEQIVVMVGDASGKGIAAGMLVLVTRTLLRAHLMAGRGVAQCLSDCNRLLTHDNPGGSFTTVFLGLLHLPTGQLTYSNAGHNPPLLRRAAGGMDSLTEANGVMLGIMDEWAYDTHQMQLFAGDCLLLYSDGVSEAHNTAHALFGQARLEGAFAQTHADARSEVAALLQRVDDFAADAEQFDDITILAMRYRPEMPAD